MDKGTQEMFERFNLAYDYRDIIRDHGKEIIDLLTTGGLEPANDAIRNAMPTEVLARRIKARAVRHAELEAKKATGKEEALLFLNEFLTALLFKAL